MPKFEMVRAEYLARKYNLNLPFERKELEKAFRRACHKCHPDKGGSQELFIALQEAKKFLLENEAKINNHFAKIKISKNINFFFQGKEELGKTIDIYA